MGTGLRRWTLLPLPLVLPVIGLLLPVYMILGGLIGAAQAAQEWKQDARYWWRNRTRNS